jgi:hypothetical protein
LGEDFASSFWVHAEDGNSKFLWNADIDNAGDHDLKVTTVET